jgi:asparagine synthase (glutamine-hydrolysing)
MLRLLRHRGPDASGMHRDARCALAQTRLALIGPERPLPVSSQDGRYTLVYNGEVYNFEDLPPGDDGSDTASVLEAWQRWSERSPAQLNGMFAFFVWDAVERRGFAATDALGIKPFFYHHTPEYFAFASEAGALIESGAVPFAADDEAIAESLTAPYFSGAVRLPFAGIKRLPPGHYLELRDGRVTITPYFTFTHGRAAPPDPDAFVDETASRLEDAVAAALRADVPPGLFLSGGVDSSLLAALAQRHSRHPVRAWTIAFAGEEAADYASSLIVKSSDRPYAEQAAAACGCRHSVVHVDEEAFDTALGETLRTNDLISAWEQEISQYLLAQAAAREVKAVLVGDAADETHFGYPFLLRPERTESPRHVIRFFGAVPLRRELLDNPVEHFTRRYTEFAEERGYRWTSPCEQRLAMSCLILHLWLTRLLHNGDIQLMAHSLEGRVPFGDIRLLALAQRLPQELGYRDGIEKWHLRSVAERFLPASVTWRPKSALMKNLRAHQVIHRRFVRAWREWGSSLEPYVDTDAVEQMARAEASRTEVEVGIRFRLLAVMTWFERFQRSHP